MNFSLNVGFYVNPELLKYTGNPEVHRTLIFKVGIRLLY